MYLDKKESELDELVRLQVKKGDTAARDRRRKHEEGDQTQIVEIRNKDTQMISDMLQEIRANMDALQNKVKQLQKLN